MDNYLTSDPWLTVRELRIYLGSSNRPLGINQAYEDLHKIKASGGQVLSGPWRVRKSSVDAWIAQQSSPDAA